MHFIECRLDAFKDAFYSARVTYFYSDTKLQFLLVLLV